MAISSVNQSNSYAQMNSMNRLASASNDPSGSAISEKLKAQSNGLNAATDNARAGQDLLNTAEGGLASITDSLQRMRELAVQASNGILGDDDRAAIQKEVDQLKSSITDAAKNTTFNTQTLLDGSKSSIDLATNPSGSGMSIQMQDATLRNLGIDNFDVTGNFSISDIDNALDKVSESRSSIGASTNALGYTINANEIGQYNMQASNSRLEDLDIGAMISEKKKNEILQQYQIFAKKGQNQQEMQVKNLIGA